MNLIVAADSKNGIGKDGRIPWHLRADLEHFKRHTFGRTVIMGRKTFESLPAKVRPLPGRHSIVLTRSPEHYESIDLRRPWAKNTTAQVLCGADVFRGLAPLAGPDAWLIGGGELYAQALELGLVDRIELTRVEGDFGCDTFWPGVPDGWVKTWEHPLVELPLTLRSAMPPMAKWETWEATPPTMRGGDR